MPYDTARVWVIIPWLLMGRVGKYYVKDVDVISFQWLTISMPSCLNGYPYILWVSIPWEGRDSPVYVKNMPSAESDRFQRVYNINRLLILVVSVSYETGDSLERTGCKQCHVKTWSISGISFQTTKWPKTKWNKIKDSISLLTSSCSFSCSYTK